MRGNGTYGIKRPSLINPSTDVEIWYHYRPERSSMDVKYENFKLYDSPGSILTNATAEGGSMTSSDNRLPGMYNLMLPVSIFGSSGYYTIYIKAKDIICDIKDVGVLSAYNDIRGIIVDTDQIDSDVKNLFTSPDSLVGYRVEYYDYEGTANGLRRQDYYRIVTSNNMCEVVSQTNMSANSASNGYRFNESARNLCFMTVTPSVSPTFKATTLPYIGTPGQRIALTNTKFDPVMIEVNVTEHDIETISTMLEGDQIRSLDRGLVTTYNKDGEIYIQQSFFTLKDSYNETEMMEVRKKNTAIDSTPNYDDIINQ